MISKIFELIQEYYEFFELSTCKEYFSITLKMRDYRTFSITNSDYIDLSLKLHNIFNNKYFGQINQFTGFRIDSKRHILYILYEKMFDETIQWLNVDFSVEEIEYLLLKLK